MPRKRHTPLSRAPLWLALLAVIMLAVAPTHAPAQLPPMGTGGQPLQPTPVPTPEEPPLTVDIPTEIDPNLPGLAREERFRRTLEVQRLYQAEFQRRERLRAQGLWPPTPTPTPTPDPSTTGTTTTVFVEELLDAPDLGLGVADEARLPFATFFMWPAAQTAEVGEEVVTHCRLLNPDHLRVDRLAVRLSWPGRYLRPVRIHQAALRPLMGDDEPLVEIDEEAGTLLYEVELERPVNTAEIALLTIVWEAREPIGHAVIDPRIGSDHAEASYRGEVVTRSVLGAETATAGASLRVIAPIGAAPDGRFFIDNSLASLQPVLAGMPDQRDLRKPVLWIDQPNEGVLKAGEWHVVDFGLNNPDAMLLDEVRLGARFDPALFEVVDSDDGNWIQLGTNLLDGPFHELWPWDRHEVNAVDNRHGELYYHHSMAGLRPQHEGGPMARAFVRVRRDAPAPIFQWIWAPEAEVSEPQTGIFLLGENVYLRGRANASEGWVTPNSPPLSPEAAAIERADPAIYRNPPE